MDRIDIHIKVPAVKYRELASRESGESSREIKKRVDDARKIQLNRFKGMKIYCNAQMQGAQNPEAQEMKKNVLASVCRSDEG